MLLRTLLKSDPNPETTEFCRLGFVRLIKKQLDWVTAQQLSPAWAACPRAVSSEVCSCPVCRRAFLRSSWESSQKTVTATALSVPPAPIIPAHSLGFPSPAHSSGPHVSPLGLSAPAPAVPQQGSLGPHSCAPLGHGPHQAGLQPAAGVLDGLGPSSLLWTCPAVSDPGSPGSCPWACWPHYIWYKSGIWTDPLYWEW